MYSYDRFQITSHSSTYILKKLSENKIKIKDFKILDEYLFEFKSSIFYRNKIKKVFTNIKLLSSSGILSLILKSLTYKIILFCIILSCLYYFYLSSFIWKVNISGSNEQINELIEYQLIDNGIKIGKKRPSNKDLYKLENGIYENVKNEIEWLEIRKKGCVINVSYLKRRKEMEDITSRGKLYASKDGVIKQINIESGVVKVKENQYVKKGDLLVDDIIEVSSGGLKPVKTIGNIIATTWYVIDVELKNIEDEVDKLDKAILIANEKLHSEVTNIIKVESQNILKYESESSMIRLRIHYAILEDISISMEG